MCCQVTNDLCFRQAGYFNHQIQYPRWLFSLVSCDWNYSIVAGNVWSHVVCSSNNIKVMENRTKICTLPACAHQILQAFNDK